MPPRIVCVDDEPRVLTGLRRRIGRDYEVSAAESGAEALELMREDRGFEVVVSDMRMPGMSGAKFLAEVRREFPDTVRVLLTGQSDLDDTIAAVNEGNIFRFLSKPCPPEILMPALSDAVDRHRAIQAERELLEGTIEGSVAVFTEILGIKDPVAFDRGTRLRSHVQRLAAELEIDDSWDFEVAAMLFQLGYAVVPGDVVDRERAGHELTDTERQLLDSHSEVAHHLLAHIPRLQGVAKMISALDRDREIASEPRVLLGLRLLRAVKGYDERLESGVTAAEAVAAMREDSAAYGAEVLNALARIIANPDRAVD